MKDLFGIPQEKIDKLFDKDMKWTFIWEKIKMRAIISASERDYFNQKLEESN